MKSCLAVFTGSPDALTQWHALPEAERKPREQRGLAAWHAGADKHRASLREGSRPLGRTKRVNSAGISDIRNHMAAFTVVRAESHEMAARMLLDHPHFAIFAEDRSR